MHNHKKIQIFYKFKKNFNKTNNQILYLQVAADAFFLFHVIKFFKVTVGVLSHCALCSAQRLTHTNL